MIVNSEGYIVTKSDNETVEPVDAPEVEIGNKSNFYFAIKDGDKYKAVKTVNCSDAENVSCEQGGDDWEYRIHISKLGEN